MENYNSDNSSLVKGLKKSDNGKCQVSLSEKITTCFTCNIFIIRTSDITLIVAQINIPFLINLFWWYWKNACELISTQHMGGSDLI